MQQKIKHRLNRGIYLSTRDSEKIKPHLRFFKKSVGRCSEEELNCFRLPRDPSTDVLVKSKIT